MGESGSGRSSFGSASELKRLGRVAREQLGQPSPQRPRQRVFLSFSSEDLQQVNAFRGQARSERSGLDFIDFSLQVPFNSEDAEYIRRGIRARIQACSVTVVLLGGNTHRSEWVDWEIRESLRLRKGVVAVRLATPATVVEPPALVENNIQSVPWDNRLIMQEIDRASRTR